jgi:hypothetical protein
MSKDKYQNDFNLSDIKFVPTSNTANMERHYGLAINTLSQIMKVIHGTIILVYLGLRIIDGKQ